MGTTRLEQHQECLTRGIYPQKLNYLSKFLLPEDVHEVTVTHQQAILSSPVSHGSYKLSGLPTRYSGCRIRERKLSLNK